MGRTRTSSYDSVLFFLYPSVPAVLTDILEEPLVFDRGETEKTTRDQEGGSKAQRLRRGATGWQGVVGPRDKARPKARPKRTFESGDDCRHDVGCGRPMPVDMCNGVRA